MRKSAQYCKFIQYSGTIHGMNSNDEVDLVFLEGDFRAGVKTNAMIADEYGITTARLSYLSRKYGWERDLKAAVTARATRKANQETQKQLYTADRTAAVVDTDAVETAAEIQKSVLLGQRKRIGSLSTQVTGMLAELQTQTLAASELNAIGELVAMAKGQLDDAECQPAQIAKRMEAFEKSLNLAARVDTAKKLADTLKTLVALERQAVGLSDNSNGDANQPPPAELTVMEQARRVAFMLALGMQQKQAVETMKQADGSYVEANNV